MPTGAVLVVTRFIVPDDTGAGGPVAGDRAADFRAAAARLQAALATCPGHVRNRLARALDDASRWVLVSEWTGVGPWRRALSAYDVRVEAVPLMALAQVEPAVYETVDDLS
jgi:heme oxygenase (mycobilin-producing)